MPSKRGVSDPKRRRELKYGFAAKLRDTATDAERLLWSLLRSKQIAGLRFRRQQPIGPYVADFYCSAARLVIELDGDQHGADRNVQYDEARTKWLVERGYKVLRYANDEFLKNPQIVLDGIANVLETAAIPLPEIRFANFDPPSRGG